MKTNYRLFTSSTLILMASCSSGKHGGGDAAPVGGPGGNGSCVTSDLCYQEAEADAGFGSLCAVGKGSLSPTACDESKYARKCETTGQVSVGDGPAQTVHATTFFVPGSKTACAGKETVLGNTPAPSTTPNPSDTTPSPKTATDALDKLKSQFCTLTLNKDVVDAFDNITLKSGASYLLTRSGFGLSVAAVGGDNAITEVDLTAGAVASATCTYDSASSALARVFPLDTPVYASDDFSKTPRCTLKAGTQLTGSVSYEGSSSSIQGVTTDSSSFSSDNLAGLCDGLSKGFAPQEALQVYAISK